MTTKQAVAVVERALETGMSVAEIADALRCTPDAIRKWRSGATKTVSRAIATNVAVLDAEMRLSREG